MNPTTIPTVNATENDNLNKQDTDSLQDKQARHSFHLIDNSTLHNTQNRDESPLKNIHSNDDSPVKFAGTNLITGNLKKVDVFQYNDQSPGKKGKNDGIFHEEDPLKKDTKIIQLDVNQEGNGQSSSNLDSYVPNQIEITWKNLCVDASVSKKIVDERGKTKFVPDRRKIVKNLSGSIKPGSFTAILGPSGCGKTTLLNFLSGRLIGSNLEVTGELILNGKSITDIDEYSNQIAYVMQDDILLATFTPLEAFKLTADLRLRKLDENQKVNRVNRLIKELGLTRCKNTKVGNSLIRGISGGERKRTSIGVELLTNPSLLFLDEPTTGLDSSTALQVIELLKELSRKGVTVMSTIHQPSSEIFRSFERLILICKGNILYQGPSEQSIEYFASQGFHCPAFSNPSDYFMKLMNEEGLSVELAQKGTKHIADSEVMKMFDKRLTDMLTHYKESDMATHIESTNTTVLARNDDSFNVNLSRQFYLLFKRAFVSQIRNPMDVMMKTFQTLVFAIACIVVFQPLGEGTAGYQNRAGVLQFLGSTMAFSAIQGALSTFSQERSLFIRERLSKSYSVGPYFWGKNLAELPFQIFYPIILTVIVYYVIGLNQNKFSYFIVQNAIMICTYFYGTSYGLIISVSIAKLDVAMAVMPILVIPMMVLGGFFVNTNNIPKFLIWIEYISMFKYSFQAQAQTEFDTPNFDYGQINPLEQLGITESLATNIVILIGLGIACRIIAYLLMYVISTPTKPKLNHKKFKNI